MEGPRVSIDTTIGDVHSVSLQMIAMLSVKADSVAPLLFEIQAQREVAEQIELHEMNGLLTIDQKRCLTEYEEVAMRLNTRTIKALELGSAGKIESAGIIPSEELRLTNEGLGDMDITCMADRLIGAIKSSGDMVLNGYARRFDFLSTSSGDLRAYNLVCDTIDLTIAGTSIIEVYTDGYLRVHFLQPGKVYYRGNPEHIEVIGEGQLLDQNLIANQ
ncbi:MAG: hypothetical protein Kow0075_09880 [Salibacteraceae bacterium]